MTQSGESESAAVQALQELIERKKQELGGQFYFEVGRALYQALDAVRKAEAKVG